jgi:ribonuclease Z
MRITLLGTGTPVLDPQRQHSALLIQTGAEKLLVDAGRGVTAQLLRANILPHALDFIFITHHHYDHIGNLGELLLTAWHNGRETPLKLFGPPGTVDLVTVLLNQVYARDIAFARLMHPDGVAISDLIQVTDVAPGLVYDAGPWQIFTEYVDHGNSLGLSQEDWPCLGYRLEAEGKVVAISGDTIPCPGLDCLARGADILIQCCYLAEVEITNPVLRRLADHIIASSSQAGQIAARNGVKKLILTHIRPKSEALLEALIEDVRRKYQGEVHLGEDLMVIEV